MSIDKQRVRAVEKLYQLGWTFIDNNWVEPKRATSFTELPNIEVDPKYKEAVMIVERNGGHYDETNKSWRFSVGTVNQQLQDAKNAFKDLSYVLVGSNYMIYWHQILAKYNINI